MKDPRTDQIIELYVKQQKTIAQVCKAVHAKQNTVRRILIENGYQIRGKNDLRMKNLDEDLLRELFLERKMTCKEIADHLNNQGIKVGHSSINNYLRKYGFNKTQWEARADRDSNYRLWDKDKLEKVKSLLESGKGYIEIADIESINLKYLNIPIRTWDKFSDKEEEIIAFLDATKDYYKTSQKFNIDINILASKNTRCWGISLKENSTQFGKPCQYLGIIYRSQKEAEIAQYLHKSNIPFTYEQKIPSTRWTCDFYLHEFNLWIEFDGLGKYRDIPYSIHPKIQFYKRQKLKYAILTTSWKLILDTILFINSVKSIKNIFEIKRIKRNDANLLLIDNHYLGKSPNNAIYFYGLFINNVLVGCCSLGTSPNKHLSSGSGGKALELNRLYTYPWLPKNSLSYFLSKIPRLVKSDAQAVEYLVSFADPLEGHTGAIYKACNWNFTGQTKNDYKYLLPDGSLVHKSKFRCKYGQTEKELAELACAVKIPIPGKYRFIIKI